MFFVRSISVSRYLKGFINLQNIDWYNCTQTKSTKKPFYAATKTRERFCFSKIVYPRAHLRADRWCYFNFYPFEFLGVADTYFLSTFLSKTNRYYIFKSYNVRVCVQIMNIWLSNKKNLNLRLTCVMATRAAKTTVKLIW